MVILYRCAGCCNTIDDLSNKVCVPNNTQGLNLSVFNMISGINKSSIYHVNVNVNLMEQNLIQINGVITINVYVSLRSIIYVKKIMFGILLHVIVKMENIGLLWMIQQLSVMKL